MAAENGVLELQEPALGDHPRGAPLQCFTKISSEKGLSSVTTLIVGSEAAVVVDPPFLVPDANAVIEFVKEKTELPVVAVFVVSSPANLSQVEGRSLCRPVRHLVSKTIPRPSLTQNDPPHILIHGY